MSYNLSNGYIDSDEASNLSFNQSDCINNTYFISSSNYHSSLGFENQNNIDISNLFIFPKNNNNDPSLITYNNNINSNYNRDTLDIHKKDKEESQNIDLNQKNKEDEKSNKKDKKLLFKSDSNSPTKLQTQIVKEAKNDNSKGKQKNRKKKTGNHNKFSGDNMRRKCKFIVLSHVMNFINKKLVEMYKYIGNGIREKQLKQINKAQIANANIEYNKSFLTKTLKQIFSDNISTRYTSLPPTKNKILIDELMNETDEIKREYFKNLFSLTFLDCIKYFSSEKDENYIKELDGLQLFKDLKNDSIELKNKNIDTDDKEYIETLEYHLKYYEKIINLKKSRNRKQITKKVKSLK